jgi:hypothetical protein
MAMHTGYWVLARNFAGLLRATHTGDGPIGCLAFVGWEEVAGIWPAPLYGRGAGVQAASGL